MAVLCVPRDKWPSLGPDVAQWIQDNLVFGPGSLQGEPARLDAEKRALLYKMYEIHPRGTNSPGCADSTAAHWNSVRGCAKTEFAAWITAAELARVGYDAAGHEVPSPVRFDHWDDGRQPGRQIVEAPFIPMMAAAEEQVQELAYGVLKWILEHSPNVAGSSISAWTASSGWARTAPMTVRRWRCRTRRPPATVPEQLSSTSMSRTGCSCRCSARRTRR